MPSATTAKPAADLPITDMPASPDIKESPPSAAKSFNERIMVFERRMIDEALNLNDGHQGKAAAYLELTYHSFRGLLRKHGLKK